MQGRVIQGTFSGRAAAATTAVDPALLRGPGSGRPLPEGLRQSLQAAFGADFADVRVHEGPQADAIGAIAFTVGTDIYFAPGRFQPQTAAGRQLLGHELAHVLQQRAGRVRNPTGSGLAVVRDQALEAEADRMGHRAAAASLAPVQAKLSAAAATPKGQAQPKGRAQAQPAGPPAPAFSPPSTAQFMAAGGADGHRVTIGTYLHRTAGLPAEAAGHTFVSIETPGGRRETWGFSPAGNTFDPRAGLGQAKTGVPGRVHRDDGGLAKPGVVTRSYAVGPEQARAALAKVAEYRARPPRFSFAGRDCGAFAGEVMRAAGLADPVASPHLARPGTRRTALTAEPIQRSSPSPASPASVFRPARTAQAALKQEETTDQEWQPTGGKQPLVDKWLNKGLYKGQPIYIHYTDAIGYAAIKSSKELSDAHRLTSRPTAKPGIYVSPSSDAMNPENAFTLLFLGNDTHASRGDYAIVFFSNAKVLSDGKITHGSPFREIILESPIDLTKCLIYGGPNPFRDVFG